MRRALIGRFARTVLVAIVILPSLAALAGDGNSKGVEDPATLAWPGDMANRVDRTVRYRFTLRNKSVEAVKDAQLRVFAPVSQTPTQRVIKLVASHAFTAQRDEPGNQALAFRVDLGPFATKVISVTSVVAFTDDPEPAELSRLLDFTKPEPFVEVDHPRIREVATNLGHMGSSGDSPTPSFPKGGNSVVQSAEQLAREAYEYVVGHVAESPYDPEDRGALYALNRGKGDCTESMYLFLALVRARGIPARGIEGFIISANTVLRSGTYHNWAEYYADGTWHLADPQQRVFGNAPGQQYLAMRIMGSAGAAPPRNWRRFEVSRPEIEVRME